VAEVSARIALCALGLVLAARPAAADEPPPRENPFACMGEAESLARGLSAAEIVAEVDKRLRFPPGADEPLRERARFHCVTAELMRRVGDGRAAAEYEQAIAIAPDEPGLELWYGTYLRNVRGPRHPLDEPAELHYYRAVEKLAAVRQAGSTQEFDDITESWTRRGLMSLYQEDGLPLLPGKAYPYDAGGARSFGLAFTSMVRASRDTDSFGEVDDVRRFTSEAAFSSSAQRLARPLTVTELRAIARTPTRTSLFNRVRLRVPSIGAFDLSYDVARAPGSQISYFTEPEHLGDVSVDTAAIGYRRAVDLAPAFDLLIDVGYRRVARTGVVEWFPDQREVVHLFEAHPAIGRFIGPDKLSLGMNYVFMAIPQVPGGPLYDRARERAIRAFWVDYAMYRPLLLPDLTARELRRTLTRGWHFYGGYALDDEAFGVRKVERRDAYFGSALRGIRGFDFTLQGTYFTADTRFASRTGGGAITEQVDPQQSNAQFRPTLILLYRLVDEETIPDVPKSLLAGLNLVVPVQHDFAVRGADTYESTRVGVELWGKLISTSLRGTTFLLTGGYQAQRFHHLGMLAHQARVELRMGWSGL
jgi:hypothetical protein